MLADHPIPTLAALFVAWLLLRRPGTWRWAALLPWRVARRLLTGGR